MKLNETYFDQLPGVGDVTGVHDYTLSMPPIMFGVPYASGSTYSGKVFWVSGYATGLSLDHYIPNTIDPKGNCNNSLVIISKAAAFVTLTDLESLRMCLGGEGEINCMESVW